MTINRTTISWWTVTISEQNRQMCTYDLIFHNRRINCTAFADVFALPSMASVSFASIPLNFLVVFVFSGDIRRRKRQWRSTQAQVHLLCLALSDISVGLSFIWGAVLGLTCDSLTESPPCARSFVFFKTGFFLTTSFNRVTTLYVTVVRAIATTNVRSALRSGSESPRRTFVEVTISGVFGGILVFLAGCGLVRLLRTRLGDKDPVDTVFLIFFIVYTVSMAAVASFIVFKLKTLNHSPLSSGARLNTADDLGKMVAPRVAVVALVLCLSNVVGIVYWAIVVFARNSAEIVTETNLTFWLNFSLILNSSVNLFIYIAVSAKFRTALVKFGKCDQAAYIIGKNSSRFARRPIFLR